MQITTQPPGTGDPQFAASNTRPVPAGQDTGWSDWSKLRLLRGLKQQHEKYRANRKTWAMLRAIAQGGSAAEAVKKDLITNPDGVGRDIQEERAESAPLVNKIGPILARFVTQLFIDAPKVEGSEEPWVEDFLTTGARLPDDLDQQAGFEQFLDQAMFNALAEGAAIAQVDTQTASGARFLAGQKQSGELSPYVVLLNRDALWDWEPGDNGLRSCKLHRFNTYRETILDAPMPEHIFTIFERDGDRVLASQYQVRRVREKMHGEIRPEPFVEGIDEANLETVDIQPTRLADGTAMEKVEIFNRNGKFEFPVIVLSLPGFLCVGDQLLGLQKEHFNNRASMNWAINRANWAMPYIKGGDTDPFKNPHVKAGNGRYLWFPGDSDYEIGQISVSSPAISSSAQKEDSISKDVYETLQQMAYLASQSPAAMARSEESRIKDKELELVLLQRHGKILKDFALKIVRCASIAAGDRSPDDVWKVDGFTKFKAAGLLSYLPLYAGLAQIGGVPVPEFKRMQFKDMVRLYGTTLDHSSEEIQETLDAVDKIPEDKLMESGQPPAPEAGADPGA